VDTETTDEADERVGRDDASQVYVTVCNVSAGQSDLLFGDVWRYARPRGYTATVSDEGLTARTRVGWKSERPSCSPLELKLNVSSV